MKIFLMLLFFLSPSVAFAQFPDLVNIDALYLPSAKLDGSDAAEVQQTSYEGTLNIPIVVNETTFLIPGVSYRADSLSFKNTPENFTELRAFHGLDANLLAVKLLPKAWSISGRASFGLAGDFEHFRSDMFRFTAVAMLTKSFEETLTLGFGGVATYAFGSLLPLPGLYLDWSPANWVQIETFLPGFFELKFKPFERIEVGLHADISGAEYAITDAAVTDSDACKKGEKQCFDHVAYALGTGGIKLSVRLFSSVWISGYGGYSFFRRFEQFNDANETIEGGLQTLPNRLLVRGSLTFRIPRGE